MSRSSALACLEVCGLLLLGGCDGGGSCPDISAGTVSAQPLQTSFQRLSSTPNVIQLALSDDGLYWHDGSALYALPEGQTEPVTLHALQDSPRRITGLLVDSDHVYWSEGAAEGGVDSGFVVGPLPPGRVLSLPKTGGEIQVLLDLPDGSAVAVGLDETRVILKLSGTGSGYYGLDKLGGSPTRLAAPTNFDSARVVGDQLYWINDGEKPLLYRAHFDATQPEAITRIDGGDFDVGPDYVLWRHDQLLTEPELLLKQNFMIWREGGCVQALPGNGESISYGTARDARYVYWHGFNALGEVTESSDGVSSPLPEMSLLRLDLQSGALARLETPGFHSILGDQILGSDARYVYLATADGLVGVSTTSIGQ